MSKHESGPEDRKRNKPVTSVTSGPRESRSLRRQLSRRRRRIVWLSSVATTVLATVLATSVTGALSHVVHSVEGLPSRSLPISAPTPHVGSSMPQRSKGSNGGAPADKNHSPICVTPLKMVSEYPLDSWEVRAWTFPAEFAPSPGQIAQINKDYSVPDLINRDLYNDGGYAPSTDTQLILQNNCSHPMTITDIQASKSCQPPLDGTIFAGQTKLSESGLADNSTQLGFNLDSSNPEAMLTNGWDVSQWTQEYASGPIVTIPGGEQHVFDIRSIALHVACRFFIVVRVLYDENTLTENFSDGGQPFRVSALLPGVLKAQRPGDYPYSGYSMLYVGGAASPWHDGTWARENPRTWHN